MFSSDSKHIDNIRRSNLYVITANLELDTLCYYWMCSIGKTFGCVRYKKISKNRQESDWEGTICYRVYLNRPGYYHLCVYTTYLTCFLCFSLRNSVPGILSTAGLSFFFFVTTACRFALALTAVVFLVWKMKWSHN